MRSGYIAESLFIFFVGFPTKTQIGNAGFQLFSEVSQRLYLPIIMIDPIHS